LIPQKKKMINGIEYTVKLMPFGRHRELQYIVFKKIGKALEHLGDAMSGAQPGTYVVSGAVLDGFLEGIPWTAIGKAISGVLETLEKNDYDRVIELLGQETTASDANGFLDLQTQELYWLKNKYANFLPWLAFAMQVQFEDFLSGLGLKSMEEAANEKAKDA